MVGSIDPRCETVRGTHWPKKVAWLFGARVAETILASDPLRPHQQAGHMDASDPIRPEKTLAARGPSTYGSPLSRGRLADGPYAMTSSLRFRAAIVSLALFLAFIGIWHI